MTRRNLLIALVVSLGAVWSSGVAALSAVFLSSTLRSRTRPDEILAGDLSLVKSKFRAVRLRIPVQDGWTERVEHKTVFIRKNENDPDAPLVLSATCTHLGCTVNWDEDKGEFVCPCHGGRFSEDGSVLSGPPPTRLARIPAEVRDGDVYIKLNA